MVTMSTDKLQMVCDQMEDDDPEAADDQPVSFVVWDTQVIPVPFPIIFIKSSCIIIHHEMLNLVYQLIIFLC